MHDQRDQYDVIVVGGGPAGSTVSGLLSKWGRRVLLLEKEKFPRYHIGESLLPGIMPVIEQLGATQVLEELGAIRKYGVSLLWGANPEPWDVRFDEVDGAPYHYAYEVKRAEFDNLLLTHTRRLGTTVIEEANVREALFEGDRCTGVRYSPVHSDDVIDVHAPFIVDASGQAKLMGRRFDTVSWHSDLKNLAAWTYFQGGIRYPGQKAGNVVIENRPPGWFWLIPFSDNTCSVGYVAPIKEYAASGVKPAAMLYQRIDESQEIKRLLTGAVEVSQVRTAKDWSYTCERMSGPGFVQVGDAAAFIDPLFSTGVVLAMASASSAASAINQILDKPDLDASIRQSYEDGYRAFLNNVVSFVRFFYDPSRKVVEYFEKARKLVDPNEHFKARDDFIILISGVQIRCPVMDSVPDAFVNLSPAV
ncbi:MAG: tryptophan 7-halogenase [Pseudonocardiaceae bacterium]